MATTLLLKYAGMAGIGSGLLVLLQRVFTMPPTEPPVLGLRGRKRARARTHNPAFATWEPILRQLGGVWAGLPVHDWRATLETDLQQAGYYLGLDANELLAMCSLAFVASTIFGFLGGDYLGVPLIGLALGALVGPWMVLNTIQSERARRFRDVGRQLPGEIDLAAMCMNAGMDMPGALSMLVEQGDENDVLVEEFGLILQELELGRTRAEALRHFADRVPTEAVREFVGAVIQAEEKGTPPAETLRIQAGMLRMRRSVLAEEAASRAGVLMMIPMMMLLGSILIILVGSLMIESYGSGFLG